MIEKSGERGRNRTYNLLIKSQLLCQLSYAPEPLALIDWGESTGLMAANLRGDAFRRASIHEVPLSRPRDRER